MTDAVNRALNAYSQVDLESVVNSATPVQLIILLYDGAITALATAKGYMQENKFAEKGKLISKAVGIIEGLRSILNFELGGEISVNLNDLYEYMTRRLALANLKNDQAGPAEVIKLLSELRGAWQILDERDRSKAIAALGKLQPESNLRETVSLRA